MGKLIPETSIVTFYRRSLTPADSLIDDAGTNPDPALDLKVIDVAEADWVTLDDTGKAIAIGATPKGLAFPVWVGGRSDAGAAKSITVIAGPHSGKTSNFDTTGGAYTAGQRLTAKNGKLYKAASGDPVVAMAEGAAAGADATYPNGYLSYNTYCIGHIVA